MHGVIATLKLWVTFHSQMFLFSSKSYFEKSLEALPQGDYSFMLTGILQIAKL